MPQFPYFPNGNDNQVLKLNEIIYSRCLEFLAYSKCSKMLTVNVIISKKIFDLIILVDY